MKKLSDFFCCFCSGYFYPPLIAVLIYLGHSFNLEIPFLILLTLIILACCIFAKDIRFLITPLLCLLFLVTADHSPNVPNYSDYYTRPQNLWVLISCGMILVLGLACFVIRHRKSFHRISLQRGLLPGILLFCLAMCLNGIGTPTYSFGNLGYGATFLVSLLLVYLLFYGFFRFDEGATDCLMYNLVIAGLLICIQLITAFFTDIQFDEAGNIIKESVILGWGVWTTIGGMLCMLMPACFYFLATKKMGWLGLIAGVTEWFCIFLSQSRGALLFGSFILLACMITASFCGSFQKRNRYFTLGSAVLGVLAFVLLSGKLLPILQNFLTDGFGDNGRFDLWKAGWNRFLESPLQGTGFYHSYINEEWNFRVMPYMYHNTLIQLLGATGVFGVLAYAFHRLQTLKLILQKPTPYKLFAGICILGLLLFSLLDVLFFNIYPMFYYALLLLFAEREA